MIAIYFLTIILLTLVSYTFVDLNLTILNWQPYLQIQQFFTWLGYYNRPLNTLIVTFLLVSLIIIFVYLVNSASKFSWRTIKILTFASAVILSLGYNAFSYDLFNYMFDARMITSYGQNPYFTKAQDFPNDDWIRFMHWVHRTYPYGPSWLAITVVPSFLGMSKFLPTFLLFKTMFAIAYILGAFLVYKIVSQLTEDETKRKAAVILYATNPLILIDGLLSPHMDSVMGTIGLIGTYYAIKWAKFNQIKDALVAVITLLISAAIKFATAPWILVANRYAIKRYGHKNLILALIVLSTIMGIAQAITLSQYQPWYGLLTAITIPLSTPYINVKYSIIASILINIPIWIYIMYAYSGVMLNAIPLF